MRLLAIIVAIALCFGIVYWIDQGSGGQTVAKKYLCMEKSQPAYCVLVNRPGGGTYVVYVNRKTYQSTDPGEYYDPDDRTFTHTDPDPVHVEDPDPVHVDP